MKKILLVLDAIHIDTALIHFACNIANLSHSKLTGIFFGNFEEEDTEVKMEFGVPYIDEVATVHNMGGRVSRQQKLEEHIRFFKRTCAVKGVRCQVQCDNVSYGSESVIEATRFADLIILQASTTRHSKPEEAPTGFVKEILATAECPVLVAPAKPAEIEAIVFAYDGSRSAVFAMKQFTYFFPELADKKAIVLQVNKEEDLPVTEREQLGNWLRLHYSSIGFQLLQGRPSEELYAYLSNCQSTMVVMGGYGRGWLSELFKPATAAPLLKTINLPFFITHC